MIIEVIGTTVGSYRIVSKLSVGGMGSVYKAEHTLIGKLAAVKVLHPELTTSRDIVQRFFNEAKATIAIKHPGIVEVFDYGHMANGDAFLVMEFLDGMSLARRCKTRGKMSEGEAAMLLRAVCSALAAAHAKGIVHRDLKPDNIYLIPDADSAIGERPKILDFGIAKLTEIGLAGNGTKTGAVMGTPTYMSPEQCRGTGEVDHRADLYSLGCIFYELLVGKPPFTNLGAGELIGAHLYVEPERPSKRGVSITPETEQLIMALLAKSPAHRPQTAKELGHRLATIAHAQGWITQTSPSGVTAQRLPTLTPMPSVTEVRSLDGTEKTLPSEPGTMTPHGKTPAPLFTPGSTAASFFAEGDAAADKPTTLSGAASQSVIDVPARRSRKGLVLAMTAAALLAGGTVAIVMLQGARTTQAAKAPPTGDVTTPTTPPGTATTATPTPGTATTSTAATGTPSAATGTTATGTATMGTTPTATTPTPTTPEAKPPLAARPDEPVASKIAPVDPIVATTKPKTKRKVTAKTGPIPLKTPPVVKPEPAKPPKKSSLIETDL